MSEPRERQREETIEAIRPVLERVGTDGARAPGSHRSRALWLVLAGAALLGLVVAVFVLLPRLVAERTQTAPAAEQAAAPATAAPQPPPLSDEERAKLEADAEAVLADLLPQQQQLEQRSAASWGGDQWDEYQNVSTRGDDAYLAEDFGTAADAYRQAIALGERLLARSDEIAAAALTAGRQAIEAGQPDLAAEQFDIVLSIDPDNEAAQAGRARAEKLPDVLAAVQSADALHRQHELEAAADAYRKALSLDPNWTPAAKGLTAVTSEIADARFERLMSQGTAALGDEDYDAAKQHFEAALKLRPGSAEARDGLMQADEGAKLDEIALAQARALAFERRELWDRAIEQYEAALAIDPSLQFARDGRDRARARADLDAKLSHLIDNPRLLFDDAVLADARTLLAEAREKAEPDTRIAGQAERLNRLIGLATTPVAVQLRSDDMTEVTLYKVGELGSFVQKEVKIRPGTYVALGSRDGYRDVRKTFTVLPGRDPPPIEVICMEPI
jgi:tetratricopeptide (TPR) repeat protein